MPKPVYILILLLIKIIIYTFNNYKKSLISFFNLQIKVYYNSKISISFKEGLIMKHHPLISTLLNLEGNPRICTYTEPLWGIPYNLFAPYGSIYMYSMGVNDSQLGLIASIGMIFQVVFSLGFQFLVWVLHFLLQFQVFLLANTD